jgi:hypothetical protein
VNNIELVKEINELKEQRLLLSQKLQRTEEALKVAMDSMKKIKDDPMNSMFINKFTEGAILQAQKKIKEILEKDCEA